MSDSTNELATIEKSRALIAESFSAGAFSDKHIQARVNMIQGAIHNVFKQDVHYGIIPGTKKPTLYKPGAEQLLVMFRIAPAEPKTEDLSTNDSIRYRVTRSGVSQIDGRFLGSGTGECSSDEEKYKWRRPVCNEEFDETAPDRKREVWKKSFGKAEKVKQIRTNHADVANTILKMADKRAMVAMTLVVTGASDAFTQDIEDLPEEIREAVAEDGVIRPPVAQPARKSAEVAPTSTATPTDTVVNGSRVITVKQAGRFFAILKASGKSEEDAREYLKTIGVTKSIEIPSDQYEAACLWAGTKSVVNTTTGEIEQETEGVGE